MSAQEAMMKRKEIEEVRRAAEVVVIQQLNEEREAAIKAAVPHPEYLSLWNDVKRATKLGDILGAAQLAIEMDNDDRKMVPNQHELYLDIMKNNIVGEPQRIKSPERVKLETSLKTYVNKWKQKPTLQSSDTYGEFGNIYPNIIGVAGYRGRNIDEAQAIVDLLVLTNLIQPNQQKLYPNAVQEYAIAATKLEKIREGLPKYVKPTDKDWAIGQLIAYVPNEKKESFRIALQAKTIEQIVQGVEKQKIKYTEPAEAKIKAAGDAAEAAMPKPKKGGWFGRSRKMRSQKLKTRKQRKI